MDESDGPEAVLIPERVGDRLRAARQKAGVDLSDIATRTRIPLRHLSAIEAGDYGSLPAPTYCVGFVRAYARALGEDEVGYAQDLRSELGLVSGERGVDNADYDAGDPARVPTKTLAWTALALAILVAGAYGLWRNGYFGAGAPQATNVVAETDVTTPGFAPENGSVAATAPATGDVVLTAIDTVWLRVYDKNNKVFIGREMKAGESFTVPPEAQDPMIRTTLPQKIKVTVGGKDVPPLGTEEKLIKDVPISAKALAARPAPTPVPSASATGGASAAQVPVQPVAPTQ